MKRGKKLLIMLLALVVAAGGYYLATKLAEKESAKQTVEEIKLVDGEVTRLDWTYNGEELSLLNDGGTWTLAGCDDCPVDQSTASAMAETVANYTAQAKIEGFADIADYGLDEPYFEATVTTEGGETTFRQGDDNSLTAQSYISKSTDDKTVYAANEALNELFAVSLLDLVKLEVLPSIGDADKVSIYGKVEQTKDESGVWRSMTGERADDVKMGALFDAIREISWVKLVDWTGETQLENPVKVACSWPDGGFAVEIGQQTDDGYLARIPDSKMVYAIDAANAEVLLATSDDSLRAKELFFADWDGENDITIAMDGVEYLLGSEIVEVLKAIETGELAQPAGMPRMTVKVNGVECAIGDYDQNYCTATVDGVTRLIPAEACDKLMRIARYAKVKDADDDVGATADDDTTADEKATDAV